MLTTEKMTTRLILIRHGETDWNYQKRYCSFTDIGLNKKGKGQMRQLCDRLTKENVCKVYSSDMRRAFQSAGIIFKDISVERLAALREMNFGIFEGLTYQRVMEIYPELYQRWLAYPIDIIIPKGEGLKTFAARVRKALTKIISENKNKTAAIVSHAGPIRVILSDILELNLNDIWKICPELGSISIIEYIKKRGRISLLNDSSYLNG